MKPFAKFEPQARVLGIGATGRMGSIPGNDYVSLNFRRASSVDYRHFEVKMLQYVTNECNSRAKRNEKGYTRL